MLFVFVLFWIASKTASRGSKRRPRGPGKPSGAPQETPRGLQERSRRPQEASRDTKNRSRGLKTHPRAPKSLPRCPQGFSEAPGSAAVFGKFKKFKARLQKPLTKLKIADIDESLAPIGRMKKGGRAAVIPLGEVNNVCVCVYILFFLFSDEKHVFCFFCIFR